MDGCLQSISGCPNGEPSATDSTNGAKFSPEPELPLESQWVEKNVWDQDQPWAFEAKSSFHNQYLSGSCVSLECPSPPAPPSCSTEFYKDPQVRLSNCLKGIYLELALQELTLPPWVSAIPSERLCSASLEPDFCFDSSFHGFSGSITIDDILVAFQTKDGIFVKAPKQCLITYPYWISCSSLCLRILYSWVKEPRWPLKGTPVSMALLIPLCELKNGLSNYVEKELLPRASSNPFANDRGGFSTVWKSLESLGPKLLILIDGHTIKKSLNKTCCGFSRRITVKDVQGVNYQQPPDIRDLLDGKLFPEARVIFITHSLNATDQIPAIPRHILYKGISWSTSGEILSGGEWENNSRLLDIVHESTNLRKVARTLLGCLAIASIDHMCNGNFPDKEVDMFEALLQCIAPDATSKTIVELGKLALFCLKIKKPAMTFAEIQMYCSEPAHVLGCFEKNVMIGKTANKNGIFEFNPICIDLMEFLAAHYIASLIARPGLLGAEIAGMAISDELNPDLLKVLQFGMALLGEKSHLLLSKLTPLWLSPQMVFLLSLAGSHNAANQSILCEILGISKKLPISSIATVPLWVQVRFLPTELMGWGLALRSTTCTLENLEITFHLERRNDQDSRKAFEVFLNALECNESVNNLRMSTIIEVDVKDIDISYLANSISKILLKPRLKNFELVLTFIEEDPPALKLQPVVTTLCRTLPRQITLRHLLLDLWLSTAQLVQLCGSLKKCLKVTQLSLPHLRCDREAVAALSSLLTATDINRLSLPRCWGAREDPPSSSGVSMGSGSGSSTCTSCLTKLNLLPGVISPTTNVPGVFSTLPRFAYVPQGQLGRSATLPRQVFEQKTEKHYCDTFTSKNYYPTPSCDGKPHNSGTLHPLFLAIRRPNSKIISLDLSKAKLSFEDAMCLGETVRLSPNLKSLTLEGMSRISEVLPAAIGASDSLSLQMVNISSNRLTMDDTVTVLSARAFANCATLDILNVDGLTIIIENMQTLSVLRTFLSFTSMRELSMCNCRVQTNLMKDNPKLRAYRFECKSVMILKLSGAQIKLANETILRGPQLFELIRGFSNLKELDLSVPPTSSIEDSNLVPLILNDKCVVNFFQNLHFSCRHLINLKICHWIMHFNELGRTLKYLSKAIRNSSIRHLKLNGISVLDTRKKVQNEAEFTHCFISTLMHLNWIGLSLSGSKSTHISSIGKAVLDLKSPEIEINLSESTIEQAKMVAQAISADGTFDVKVLTFGTSSGILIHAEKLGK